MKKCIIFCVILVCAIFFTSCVKNSSGSSSSSPSSSSVSAVSSSSAVSAAVSSAQSAASKALENYSTYNMSSEKDTFSEAMNNNVIDTDFNSDMQNAVTTAEFIDCVSKFTGIWKSDIQNTITNLKQYLTSEDDANLDSSEKAFEDSVSADSKLEHNIVFNSEYKLGAGSFFSVDYALKFMNEYRDRAVSLRYWLYLLESSKSTLDYKSLKFNYQP